MTRDEARKILGEEATEEQITNLLNNFHIQESNKVKELENQINSLTATANKYSDYDEIKKQLDDINKANMSEQEKLEAQKKEIETNLKNSRIIVNTAKAKEILAGLDLDDDIISLVVSDDETKTISSANKLKAKFDMQKENVAKETKESLINIDLTPSISNVNQNDTMTLDKFDNMSAEEQIKWLDENPNGLDSLN
jgi:formamidopyrimidine-DNA glycosylase